MKTLTQTLFATVFTAVILSSSAISASAAGIRKTNKTTEAAAPVTFNKIVVSGNVKVILVQGGKEAVNVDENFDAARTSIKKQGYSLMIHSTEINPVTITVSVKDLHRIDISGISSVETKGNFDLKYLQVFMSHSTTANINAKTESMYTQISDEADLKLSGSTKQHTFMANQAAKANLDNFVCYGPERLTDEAIAAISLNRAIVGKSK
ncbi:MAG: DUF2807 domain-containing protein [Bacteroidota bacterium]